MGFDLVIKNWLAFARRLDFFIIIGFMFLIGMVFHIYTIIRKVQNRFEKIVAKIALKEAEKVKPEEDRAVENNEQ